MLKTKDVKLVSLYNWDQLVIDTYNKPYSLQQQGGCMSRGMIHLTIPTRAEDFENDTIPEEINGTEMGVSFKAWLEKDKPEFKNVMSDVWSRDIFWERNFYPALDVLANDLYKRGLLDAGEYSIDIDW